MSQKPERATGGPPWCRHCRGRAFYQFPYLVTRNFENFSIIIICAHSCNSFSERNFILEEYDRRYVQISRNHRHLLYCIRSASDNSNSSLPLANNRSCFDLCSSGVGDSSGNTLCICNAHASLYVEDRKTTANKTLKSDSFRARRSDCHLGPHPPSSHIRGQSPEGDYTVQSEHTHTWNTRGKKIICEPLLRARVIHLQRSNLGLRNCDITSRRGVG